MANHTQHTHETTEQNPFLSDNVNIEFTVAWADVQKILPRILKSYQKQVKSAGFRQGKVPLNLVLETVGKDRVYQEVAQYVVPPAYAEAVKAKNLKPIAEPEIHVESMNEDEDWKFHAHVAEKPEIDLGKYKPVVKKALASVKPEPEEKKKSKKTDEPDQKEETAEQKELKLKQAKINAALTALQEKLSPKIQELLVRQEMNRSLEQMEKQLKQFNIEPEVYLKSLNKTVEEVRQEHAAQALGAWQVELIIDQIATEEKIEVSDDDVNTTLKVEDDKPLKRDELEHYRNVIRKQKVLDYLLTLE